MCEIRPTNRPTDRPTDWIIVVVVVFFIAVVMRYTIDRWFFFAVSRIIFALLFSRWSLMLVAGVNNIGDAKHTKPNLHTVQNHNCINIHKCAEKKNPNWSKVVVHLIFSILVYLSS